MSTCDKIKAKVLNIFAELGFGTAILADIASSVGIKSPSIYAFFANKEVLFLEIWSDSQLSKCGAGCNSFPPQQRYQAAPLP